ncbi:MAG: relaxase domain-containing protein, partial [Actinomycetota bacterium]|nr:relaxase domain-containing protein [Actinomycetota bacterium]
LAALLQWRHPRSGEALVRRPTRTGELREVAPRPDSVRGYDLTFAAPKSVSVLFGVARRRSRAAREAHDAAVRDAIGYLERHACLTRRGHDGHERLRGEGLVAAGFRHRTSRAGDSQLHTHVVCANLTRADGRFSTLDGRAIYAHARTAGFLYQARLRCELAERLGVEWGPVGKGAAEITGVPQEVLAIFSQRAEDVARRMAERGERSYLASRVAVLDTRRAKEYGVSIPTLRHRWRERAEALGFDDTAIAELLARPAFAAWRSSRPSTRSPRSASDPKAWSSRRSGTRRPSGSSAIGSTNCPTRLPRKRRWARHRPVCRRSARGGKRPAPSTPPARRSGVSAWTPPNPSGVTTLPRSRLTSATASILDRRVTARHHRAVRLPSWRTSPA